MNGDQAGRLVRRLDEMPDADLERFHDGYRRHFDDALAEINGGRKAVALDVVHLPPGRRTRHQPDRRPLRHPRPGRSRRVRPAIPSSDPATAPSSTPSGDRSSAAACHSARCSADPTTTNSSPRSPCSPASPASSARLGDDRRPGQRDPRPRRDAGSGAVRHHTNDSWSRRCSTLTPPRSTTSAASSGGCSVSTGSPATKSADERRSTGEVVVVLRT